MTKTVLELARLSGAEASEDGKTVRFRIEGKAGEAAQIACDHGDIEGIIHFLTGLGRLSAARRGDVTPHRFGQTDKVDVSPIQVSDVGLMRGLHTEEAVLVLRMFGFDLGFQVNPAQLAALHGEIERILPGAMLHASDHHHHHDHDH